jgi:ppGpp synthetase/RelA/SpoT-type nucleotidyltranferase
LQSIDTEVIGAWLRRQIHAFEKVQPRYVLYADTLRGVLAEVAGLLCPNAVVQARAKSLSSFAEKALRKRSEFADPIRQFTDLCGARVITTTLDELGQVCRFIEEHFKVDWPNSLDASERLGLSEFGYRSIHRIVQFKPGVFPSREIDLPIPDDILGLKAEIQVRTLLQHAHADFTHDRCYKGAFEIPGKWTREIAGVAALLEEADKSFARVVAALQAYASDYEAYLTGDEMREKIHLLSIILDSDRKNSHLAVRIAHLAIALGEWQKAIDVLQPYLDAGDTKVLGAMGIAMCRLHWKEPLHPDYRRGQDYLNAAYRSPTRTVDSIASYAGTLKHAGDITGACNLYREAVEIDPTHPYPLGNFFECTLMQREDAGVLATLRPMIRAAIQRCRDQADVRMNLPWAFFDMGRFKLLLGQSPFSGSAQSPSSDLLPDRKMVTLPSHSEASLISSAKGVQLANHGWMIRAALQSVENIFPVSKDLKGFESAKRLLTLGWAARFPSWDSLSRLVALKAPDFQPVSEPVLIIAGDGNDSGRGHDPNRFGSGLSPRLSLLAEALASYNGTIISGGTRSGVSGLVGELQARGHDPDGGDMTRTATALTTLGYLPQFLPKGVRADQRYTRLIRTEGVDFSPLEPLRYWIDILASGIRPYRVRLLGIGGGALSALEYRIALALGAHVGIVEDSGRAAEELLADKDWQDSGLLVRLPSKTLVPGSEFMVPGTKNQELRTNPIQAFLAEPGNGLLPAELEAVAKAIHEAYRAQRRKEAAGKPARQRALEADPAMADWSKLAEDYKRSNRMQADDIIPKLWRLGLSPLSRFGKIGTVPSSTTDDARRTTTRLTESEIELLAELEHARWNAERFFSGWTHGDERNKERKITPYLVDWSDLPEDIRAYDRQTVRKIPEYLLLAGLGIGRGERW